MNAALVDPAIIWKSIDDVLVLPRMAICELAQLDVGGEQATEPFEVLEHLRLRIQIGDTSHRVSAHDPHRQVDLVLLVILRSPKRAVPVLDSHVVPSTPGHSHPATHR
jgi:hypothetical protein